MGELGSLRWGSPPFLSMTLSGFDCTGYHSNKDTPDYMDLPQGLGEHLNFISNLRENVFIWSTIPLYDPSLRGTKVSGAKAADHIPSIIKSGEL